MNSLIDCLIFSALGLVIVKKLAHPMNSTAICWITMDLFCCQSELNTRENSLGKSMELSWTHWCKIESSEGLV